METFVTKDRKRTMNTYQLVLREDGRPVDVRYWRSSSIKNVRARAVKEFSNKMFYGLKTSDCILNVGIVEKGKPIPMNLGNIFKSSDDRLWWSAWVQGRYQKYWINKDGSITEMNSAKRK